MRQSVYLATTIPSHYFDNSRPELNYIVRATHEWWDNESCNYDLFTSEYTVFELNRGSYPNKNKFIDLIGDIEILPFDDEIESIAEVYVKEYVMPKGDAGDAFHLACASFYKIDFLLTWNCNHLANANKERHIHLTNAKLNLFTPIIITPLQLFHEENSEK